MEKKMITYSLFLFVFSVSLFAQKEAKQYPPRNPENDSLQFFYIIDEAYQPKSARIYNRDYTPSYIQAYNGESIVTSRVQWHTWRHTFYMLGKIDGYKETKNEKGERVVSYYIRGKTWRFSGKLKSVEITYLQDKQISIHYYDKLGNNDWYFKVHIASLKEIKETKDYWKNHKSLFED